MACLLVIGDSNLRRALPWLEENESVLRYPVTFDHQGGRTTLDLRFLSEKANQFSHVLVVCGNNDVNKLTDDQIVHNFKQFMSSLKKGVEVRIMGFWPRKDHKEEFNADTMAFENPVTRINLRLFKEFKKEYCSPRDMKYEDFLDNDNCHLNETGKQHLSRFIYRQCKSLLD